MSAVGKQTFNLSWADPDRHTIFLFQIYFKRVCLLPSFVAKSLCSESLPFLQEPDTFGMGTPPAGKQVNGVQQGVAPKPFAHATPSLKQSVISFAS